MFQFNHLNGLDVWRVGSALVGGDAGPRRLVLRVHVVEARPVVLPPLEGPLSQDAVHWLEWTFSW